MKAYILLWLILQGVFGVAVSLDDTEVDSLQSLLEAFPSLLLVSPYEQYGSSLEEEQNWGGPWTKPMSAVCSGGDGYDVYGIYCERGHVTSLRFSVGFGNGQSPYSLLGLVHLSEFILVASSRPDPQYDGVTDRNMLQNVLGLESLKRIDVQWRQIPGNTDFPYAALSASNLTHVRISSNLDIQPDISGMSYLQEVELSVPVPFLNLSSSAAHLRSLKFTSYALYDPTNMDALHVLENLSFKASSVLTSAYLPSLVIPPSLKSLSIDQWPRPSLSIGDANSNLETLALSNSESLVEIGSLPASLKEISFESNPKLVYWDQVPNPCNIEKISLIQSFNADDTETILPDGLGGCAGLKSLSFEAVNSTALESMMAGLDLSTTALEAFEVRGLSNWPSTNKVGEDFICNFPPATFSSLSLSFIANIFTYPPCIANFPNIMHLELTFSANSAPIFKFINVSSSIQELRAQTHLIGVSPSDSSGWQTLATKFPGLKRLELMIHTGSLDSPFPFEQLQKLTQLEILSIPSLGFTGTIPNDFLKKLPKLKILRLNSNSITGAIPSSGWFNLVEVSLGRNQFTDWTYLEAPGAPNLKSLNLASNPQLRSLPNDLAFSTMTSLKSLTLSALPSIEVPLPLFWANGQFRLHTLETSTSSFQGTLPSSIQSPFLRKLRVDGNKLCGPLPEIPTAMGLEAFQLGINRFMGSIPSSWASNLNIHAVIGLGSNLLAGNIIPMATNVSRVELLDLSGNYFTGPLHSMSVYPYLNSFYGTGENNTWALCTQDPEWPSNIGAYYFDADSGLCACPSLYPLSTTSCPPDTSEIINPIPPFNPILPVSPPPYTCVTPKASPSLFYTCPLPSPGSAFICVNGAWTSTGTVTQPTLTVPIGASIFISGNLSITGGGVQVTGLESHITVNGCIFLGDNIVTIELTADELEQLAKEGTTSKTILTALSGCTDSTDLTGTSIIATTGSGSKKCQKLKAENSGSTSTSLVVVFSVDSSSCNTKWIILGSVLGGVIVLGVVGMVLLVTFNDKARAFFRPHSTRTKNP